MVLTKMFQTMLLVQTTGHGDAGLIYSPFFRIQTLNFSVLDSRILDFSFQNQSESKKMTDILWAS